MRRLLHHQEPVWSPDGAYLGGLHQVGQLRGALAAREEELQQVGGLGKVPVAVTLGGPGGGQPIGSQQ
jgi:hypothetical protein